MICLEEMESKPFINGNVPAYQNGSSRHSKESSSLWSNFDNFFDNFFRGHRFVALLIKNFIRMWRNIGFLAFQFLIPVIQVDVEKRERKIETSIDTNARNCSAFNYLNWNKFIAINYEYLVTLVVVKYAAAWLNI